MACLPLKPVPKNSGKLSKSFQEIMALCVHIRSIALRGILIWSTEPNIPSLPFIETSERYFVGLNNDNAMVDHNLFELFVDDKKISEGLWLYLNSTIFSLFRELISRVNLGDGATKTEGVDWKMIQVPNVKILKKCLKKGLQAIVKYPYQTIIYIKAIQRHWRCHIWC